MSTTPGIATPPVSWGGPREPSPVAEAIRIELAEAWGDMGASWGVAPAIARVQIYLMARERTADRTRGPRGARAVATGRPASPSPRRRSLGRRRAGRGAAAGRSARTGRHGVRLAVGDHWRWFGRVIEQRKAREGDPIIDVLERTAARGRGRRRGEPRAIAELAELRDWLSTFLCLRAPVRPGHRARPGRSSRASSSTSCDLLGAIPDDDDPAPCPACSAACPIEDVLDLVDALSRLSPGRGAARDQADGRGRQDRRALRPRRHGLAGRGDTRRAADALVR